MNKDITTLIEESLWNDRDGVLLGALGEILKLRARDASKQKKMLSLIDAVEVFKSSVNDYFEAVTLHDVELIRRKSIRGNVTHSDVIEGVSSDLMDIINSSSISGSLESSLRMAADQMNEASELVDTVAQDALEYLATNQSSQ